MKRKILGALVASVLAIPGCFGQGLCPPCGQTETTFCDNLTLDDGTNICYEYSPGNSDLPTIVVVHGWNGSYLDAYRAFPKGDFPVLTFSLPGHYCSQKAKLHSIELGVQTLEKLLETNNDKISDDYLLAGYSLGGMVVAKYFAEHPAEKIGAIIVSSQDVSPEGPSLGIFNFIGGVSALFLNEPHLREYMASVKNFYVRDELKDTSNNWLIFSGRYDNVIPNTRDMADNLGERARFFELNSGHILQAENFAEINRIIKENLGFLRRGN